MVRTNGTIINMDADYIESIHLAELQAVSIRWIGMHSFRVRKKSEECLSAVIL
jgi:hypothetical protein